MTVGDRTSVGKDLGSIPRLQEIVIVAGKMIFHWNLNCFSLTAPNWDHFAQVSLKVLEFFWMQLPKLKNLFANLKHRISSKFHWQRGFLALAMVLNLLLSYLTNIAKANKPLCQWNLQGYFFQLATKSCKLEPRPKVTKRIISGLGVSGLNQTLW